MTFELAVQSAGGWQWLCFIEAESYPEAFRVASLRLQPEHYDKPVWIVPKPGGEPGPEGE